MDAHQTTARVVVVGKAAANAVGRIGRTLAGRADHHPWVTGVSLCVLALLLRLVFIWQTRHVPTFEPLVPGLDAAINWQAAVGIRFGAGEPNIELMLQSAPLYPFWLAGHQVLFGESMLVHRVITAVWASLRFGFVFWAARHLTGRVWAATLATTLLLALPTLVFFDTILLKASLDVTLLVALTSAVFAVGSKSTDRQVMIGGLVVGALLVFALLDQLNTVLYVVAVIVFAAAHESWNGRLRCVFLGSSCAVFAIVLGSILFYQRADVPARACLPRAGVDVRIGFHKDATGYYDDLADIPSCPYGHALVSRIVAEVEEGRPLSMGAADRVHQAHAWNFIRDNPAIALGLVVRKAGLFFNNFELKQEDYFAWVQDQSLLLARTPWGFGLFVILGAVGGVTALSQRRRRAELVFLFGIVAAVLLTSCLTFVGSRFRLPTVVPLALLAALALSDLPELLGRGRTVWAGRRGTWLLVGTLAVAAYVAYRPAVSGAAKVVFDRRAASNVAASVFAEVQERRLDDLRARLVGSDGSKDDDSVAVREQEAQILDSLQHYRESFVRLQTLAQGPAPSRWTVATYRRYLAWLGRYREAARYDSAADSATHMDPPVQQALKRFACGDCAEATP